jgi:hypothetical protein
MARREQRRERPLPAPLPPQARTVGQLVGETIKLYSRHFIRALPFGLVVAITNQLAVDRAIPVQMAIFAVAGPFFTIAYADAARLATGAKPGRENWLIALAAGTIVFLPAAVLIPWFKLAVVVLFAVIGLVVPVAIAERRSFRDSFGRAFRLGRVDYVHAVGSLATLVLIFGLAELGLALLLESEADNAKRTAFFLADTVLGPLLFLGGALLYVDQAARLRSREERGKERDADVPDADDPDGEGNPDAAREPGTAP